MKIKLDSEFERLIPEPSAEEYAQLKENIKDDGVLDPVKVWAGQNILVDGYTRFRICKELDIKIPDSKVEELEFVDRTEAIIWILNNQLGRRNVNHIQRTSLLAQILKYQEDDTETAARALGVSRRTVQRDKTVAKAAESLPQDIKDRIETGNLAATKADLKRFAGLPDEEKQKVIEAINEDPSKHFNDAMPAKQSRLVLDKDDQDYVNGCTSLSPESRARIRSGSVRITKASLEEFKRLAVGKQQIVDDIIAANEDVKDLGDAIRTAKKNFPSKATAPKSAVDLNSRIDKAISDLINMFDSLCAECKDESLPYRDDCVSGMKMVRSRWSEWTRKYK